MHLLQLETMERQKGDALASPLYSSLSMSAPWKCQRPRKIEAISPPTNIASRRGSLYEETDLPGNPPTGAMFVGGRVPIRATFGIRTFSVSCDPWALPRNMCFHHRGMRSRTHVDSQPSPDNPMDQTKGAVLSWYCTCPV